MVLHEKKIAFRVDSSLQIGTGHVMRCLTLATELVSLGAQVEFICRAHDGNLIDLIEKRGFRVLALPKVFGHYQKNGFIPPHSQWLGCDWEIDVQQCCDVLRKPVDWIIVDHYALDHRWEAAMRRYSQKIFVIDDLADRTHDCDILLDQSLGRCEIDYDELVPKHARLLIGPKFALLRPEFSQWRHTSLARRETPQLRHILVTMGGVDADNMTGCVLAVLKTADILTLDKITVVLGAHAPWRDQVTKQASYMPIRTEVLCGVDNMAELMTSCDLAIGAGGGTTWERCALGVPSIIIILAENQLTISLCLHKSGAAFVIDPAKPFRSQFCDGLKHFGVSGNLQNIVQSCATICDGEGNKRVVSELVHQDG